MFYDQSIYNEIYKTGVIAVLVIDRTEDAVPTAKALIDNGINAIELTLRTSAALDALQEIKANVPEMIIGVGTVLEPGQIRRIVDNGASFAVAPGLNPAVIEEAKKKQLPFAPGVVTPSDIECAIELGCDVLKFFPAEPSGGMNYLKSMSGPYKHLDLKYIPLGGLNAKNMREYLESDLVPAIGGSWLAASNLIAQENWSQIARNAKEASSIVKEIRG